jgi:hypothetical protein
MIAHYETYFSRYAGFLHDRRKGLVLGAASQKR